MLSIKRVTLKLCFLKEARSGEVVVGWEWEHEQIREEICKLRLLAFNNY